MGQSSSTARLFENLSADNSAPTAAGDGIKWDGHDEALLVIKDRTGSGTMTLTGKLWGQVSMKNNADGSITSVAAASFVDGETVVISDGVNSNTFEFRAAGSVTAGNILVDISSDTTSTDTATSLALAINSTTGMNYKISATSSTDTVTVINTSGNGASGNVTITETVADGSFAVSGMENGYDFVWVPLGTSGTDADKGKVNAENAVGETAADDVAHTELISGLNNFTRVHLEATSVTGTYDAYLIPR